MLSQSEIHSRLKQIWQNFAAAGVTDPLTIIESLAYFFLWEEFQIGVTPFLRQRSSLT
mgnify:CR=1 FL=1